MECGVGMIHASFWTTVGVELFEVLLLIIDNSFVFSAIGIGGEVSADSEPGLSTS